MKRERGRQKRTILRETERSEKGKIQERGRGGEREGEREREEREKRQNHKKER